MTTSSGYVIRGGRAGADRLQVLARALRPGTEALLDRVGVPVGARCLDVGCGAGDVALELARRVGGHGRVTGVDMDAVKLQVARERAVAAGLDNITFVVGEIARLPDLPAQDVVYSRNVVQHLTQPVNALRAMWAQVDAGGVLVAEDADFPGAFSYPRQPAVDFWIERYSEVLRLHGGDPESGRKLVSHFLAAGLPDPTVHVIARAHVDGEGKQIPYLTVQATAEAMMAAGVATPEEIEEAAARLRELSTDSTVLFGMPLTVQVWSRRG
ncbi:MAG: methyltransferase domain-containing protein [bacterium]